MWRGGIPSSGKAMKGRPRSEEHAFGWRKYWSAPAATALSGVGHPPAKRHPRPIPFPWHQIQRADIRFQGKTGTVLLRPRGTLTGAISLGFHLKCSKSVPLLPRRARAKESASPIPALPVLRVLPGGGRNAPDDGVKCRWRIEPPTGWKRGRTTGVLARRAGGCSTPKAPSSVAKGSLCRRSPTHWLSNRSSSSNRS
jgi:hypothetical protein